MDNWKMVLANLEHVIQNESIEQIKWYGKSKEVKWDKKIMKKKH